MFGFGKKITITDTEVRQAMDDAAPIVEAVCSGNPKLAAMRDALPAFLRENNLDPDIVQLARGVATASWLAEMMGVREKDIVKANPALSRWQKTLSGYAASLGFVKGAQLSTATGHYCAVWGIAARGAKEVVSACLSTDG
jgi:phage tail protein X